MLRTGIGGRFIQYFAALLGNEKYLFDDYKTGITAKTHAQLAWCDNNLHMKKVDLFL